MRGTKRAQANEIRALKRMKDREIDTTDIPPVLDWSKAVVGKFYRPIKKPLTIRLDSTFSPGSKDKAEAIRLESTPSCEVRWKKPASKESAVRASGHPRGHLAKIRRREAASQGRTTRRGGR